MRKFSGALDIHAGLSVRALETPTLVVDLDAMERNIERMARFTRQHAVHWRAHAKLHKSAELAQLLIQAGARGCCVQKVSEAQAMAAGGVDDIFISNEVLCANKLRRVWQLAAQLHGRGGQLAIAVDSLEGVNALVDAAPEALQQSQKPNPASTPCIDVLVELNVGQNRAGVQSPQEVLDLAQAIAKAGCVRFAGLHAYHGGAQHIEQAVERRNTMEWVYAKVRQTIQALERAGFKNLTVTGAGTGTFSLEADSGLYTELQPGSFLLMDAHYAKVQPSLHQPVFEQALFVKAQVISRATHHAVVDAGHKSHAIDSGLPMVWNGSEPANLTFGNGGDEHGLIRALAGAPLPELGQTLWLVPGHCDPTINLHDVLVGVRGGLTNGVVERVISVDARGAMW